VVSDGSSYYNDSFNFLLYSGSKNLFGHHKHEQSDTDTDTDTGTHTHTQHSIAEHSTDRYEQWSQSWGEDFCACLYRFVDECFACVCAVSDNLFIYPDLHPSYGQPVCSSSDSGDAPDEEWANNRCIFYAGNDAYALNGCDPANPNPLNVPYTANNTSG